jgi:hypothetical protein
MLAQPNSWKLSPSGRTAADSTTKMPPPAARLRRAAARESWMSRELKACAFSPRRLASRTMRASGSPRTASAAMVMVMSPALVRAWPSVSAQRLTLSPSGRARAVMRSSSASS